MSDVPKLANIYKLTEPEELTKNFSQIRELVFLALKLKFNPQIHQFSISPLSGWVCFENMSKLYSDKGNVRIQLTQDRRVTIISNFIKDYGISCNNYAKNNKQASAVIKIFPQALYLFEEIRIYEDNERNSEQWIMRYGINLRLSNDFGSSNIPVKNGLFEVRINSAGEIIAFTLRWRSIKQKASVAFTPFQQHDDEHEAAGHNGNKKDKAPPVLMYYLAGANSVQSHLCPYFFQMNGHHYQMSTASDASITIILVKTLKKDSIDVHAEISGGSKKFKLEWGAWNILEGLNGSFTELGNNLSCMLTGGVQQLCLTVTDLVTRVVAQQQEMIFTGMIDANNKSPTREISGCTDPSAINYNPKATYDDGSCIIPKLLL